MPLYQAVHDRKELRRYSHVYVLYAPSTTLVVLQNTVHLHELITHFMIVHTTTPDLQLNVCNLWYMWPFLCFAFFCFRVPHAPWVVSFTLLFAPTVQTLEGENMMYSKVLLYFIGQQQ